MDEIELKKRTKQFGLRVMRLVERNNRDNGRLAKIGDEEMTKSIKNLKSKIENY